ncbi:MAG: hypothetical protein QM723_35010 [Myxococcaceae bacterium]
MERQKKLEGALNVALEAELADPVERYDVSFHLAEMLMDCWPLFESMQRGEPLGEGALHAVEAPLIHWPYHLGCLWTILSKRLLIDPTVEGFEVRARPSGE